MPKPPGVWEAKPPALCGGICEGQDPGVGCMFWGVIDGGCQLPT